MVHWKFGLQKLFFEPSCKPGPSPPERGGLRSTPVEQSVLHLLLRQEEDLRGVLTSLMKFLHI